MPNFKDYMISITPPWLRDPGGEAYARAIGDQKDSLLDRAKQAVKARFISMAPYDALIKVGGERQIPKAPGETFANYMARLLGAWNTWPWAGTAFGVLQALWDSGYGNNPEIHIQSGKKYKLDGSKALVITDQDPLFTSPLNHWTAFLVYFPTMPAAWGGTPPVANSDEARFIVSLVMKWKSAHARLDRVIVQGTGHYYGVPASLTWGSFTYGGAFYSWTP